MNDLNTVVIEQIFPFEQLDTSVISTLAQRDHDDQRLADHSIELYTYTAQEFNQYLQITGQNVSFDSIKSFFEHVRFCQAPASYNVKRQALKKVLKAQKLVKNNIVLIAIVNEIFYRIKKIKDDHAVFKDKYLTQDEVKELISITPKRLGLVIEFLFKTGLRISEMINIRLKDIEVRQSAKIRVVGKGNKLRMVFVDLNLYHRILDAFNPEYTLFETQHHSLLHRVNVSADIAKYGRQLGKKIGAHTLRHSCIMHLLQFNNLKYVSKYAGHSSSAITADMYVHEHPDEEVISFFDFE